MQLRSIIITALGLALAGGSAYLAKGMMSEQVQRQVTSETQTAQPTLATVVVALVDIRFGQAITPDMVAARDWPRDALPEGAFQSLDQVLATADGKPRSAKRAISAGELLLSAKVSDFGEKVTILQTLTPGTRAMTIEVDAVSGVAGFVNPGDFVDIVLTENRTGDLRARTIMQNIRVIGVDQNYGDNENAAQVARTITVEVTPEDGQKLALAQRAGSLSLTLRTLDGGDSADLPAMSLNELLDIEPAQKPEINAVQDTSEPKRTVTIRRGNEAEVVELNN